MRRLPLILVSALLATAALACGGDKATPRATPSPSTASPTPSALTKEAYVAAVNTICKRVAGEIEVIEEPKSAKEYESTLVKAIDIIDRAQADIKAVAPPAADAAAIQTNLVGPNDEQAAKFKEALPAMRAAAAADDLPAAEKAFDDALLEDNAAADTWMKSYGLTDCV